MSCICVIVLSSVPFTYYNCYWILNCTLCYATTTHYHITSLFLALFIEVSYHARQVSDLVMYICDRFFECASYYNVSIVFKRTMIYAKHLKLKIEQHEPKTTVGEPECSGEDNNVLLH